VFLVYDAEDWYDTAGEQDVADEMRLHEEFMAAVTAAGARPVPGHRRALRRHQGSARWLLRDRRLGPRRRSAPGRELPAGHVEVRPVMDLPDEG
jgi:hypothetical protein